MDAEVEVSISAEIIEVIEPRADAADFDDVEAYIEYILSEVVYQLDDVDTSASVEESEVKSRLKTLGYLE